MVRPLSQYILYEIHHIHYIYFIIPTIMAMGYSMINGSHWPDSKISAYK